MTNAIDKFNEFISQTPIPLIEQQKGAKAFEVIYDSEKKNIVVPATVLAQRTLTIEIFYFVIKRLLENNGELTRGNGQGNILGSPKCTLNSIEGLIAINFYGRKENDKITRRVTAVANILVAAGICSHKPNVLKLNPEFMA